MRLMLEKKEIRGISKWYPKCETSIWLASQINKESFSYYYIRKMHDLGFLIENSPTMNIGESDQSISLIL